MDKETENQNVNQEEGLLANTPQTEEVEPKEEETTIMMIKIRVLKIRIVRIT